MYMPGLPTIVVWAALGAINFSADGLRQTYDLISIGRPIPSVLPLPEGVRWAVGKGIRLIEFSQEGRLSQRRERVAVWVDCDGRILAKCYRGNSEQVHVWILWFASRDEVIWDIAQEYVDAALTMPGLRGRCTPLGILEVICRTFLEPRECAQFSHRIDELFDRAHNQSQPPDTIPDSVVMRKRLAGLNMRIRNQRAIVRVEITETHDRSLVIWTLVGYGYALTHGGRFP